MIEIDFVKVSELLAYELAEKNYFDCPYDVYSDRIKSGCVCLGGTSACVYYESTSNSSEMEVDEDIVVGCYLDVFTDLCCMEEEKKND